MTRPDLHEWVRRLFHERSTQRLSVQALETLAVVAYRQPVTALEITEIRGVNTSGVLNTLLERHLDQDRRPQAGRRSAVPVRHDEGVPDPLRLNDLTDLPKVEDMAEALGIEGRRHCSSSARRRRSYSRSRSPIPRWLDEPRPNGPRFTKKVGITEVRPRSEASAIKFPFRPSAPSVTAVVVLFRVGPASASPLSAAVASSPWPLPAAAATSRDLTSAPANGRSSAPTVAKGPDRHTFQVRSPGDRSRRTSSAPAGCSPREP